MMDEKDYDIEYDLSVEFEVNAETDRSIRAQLRRILNGVMAESPVENLFSISNSASSDNARRRYRVGVDLCHELDCEDEQQ